MRSPARDRPARRARAVRLAGFSALVVGLVTAIAPGAEPLLERDVLPLLQKRCMGCHGGLRKKGKLDLRTVPAMLAGGRAGPAVVAGRPDESELWRRIADDDMPEGEEKLSPEEKATIRAWIDAGLPTVADRAVETPPASSPGERHTPADVADAIDRLIERRLEAAGSRPAPLASDAEFLRRVSLDLTGRVPTAEEAVAFLDDPDPEKRAKLIDSLLASPHHGEQMGRTWRDWICPPELPSDANSGKQPVNEARELGRWLGERFGAGTTWDGIVRELLTADGEVREHPQLIFYGLSGDQAKATADGAARAVASLFLGVQLQCAQCHDDPYRDWSQSDFWSLAAFFGGVRGDFGKVEEAEGKGRIEIPGSAFANVGVEVSVALLRGDAPSADEERRWRSVLVEWMTRRDNPFFARAFVNRAWFQLFARGIVDPVDDARELNPPSHPEVLRLLADEFAASGFDSRHLLRCVCNSRAYQRTSAVESSESPMEHETRLRLFGRAPVRVMTADMLHESLRRAYGDAGLDLRSFERQDGNASGESAPVGDATLEFHRKFGTNEDDATDFTHGVPQMLTLINHPRLLEGSLALREELRREPEMRAERAIEWLYLATLSRRPDGEEVAEAVGHVEGAADRQVALDEVLWMLVNRSEFICVR